MLIDESGRRTPQRVPSLTGHLLQSPATGQPSRAASKDVLAHAPASVDANGLDLSVVSAAWLPRTPTVGRIEEIPYKPSATASGGSSMCSIL